ncbi:sirohydrochlorin chelatase [Planctomicrobium piriforme]|uniref:CbiX protein n=1 Tax=Planctomicrobium piriforme TaxID=1576369 RepID=A0A1I3FVF1_9PLAN|nr:CbiX/SirB N-terminal domain-containing protein [Planctomicrobium piriforme]SFI15230.1 CbiX protein [Planctomicrobium piriforme]
MSAAILLIAHGSRRPEANADLERVAAQLRPRVEEAIVEIAYLELADPTIPHGLRRCVEGGASSIKMLPYFLSAGAHVTRDLENARLEFMQEHPGVTCQLCPPLGLHPRMLEILLDRLQEEFPAGA